MKKAHLIILLGLILSGCSYTDVTKYLPTPVPPTATATATIYLSPTVTPTITPTQPTPTFTLTPTLIYPNGTPIPSSTPTVPVTLAPLTTPESATVPVQPLSASGPFSSILVSGTKLYWGKCEPSSVSATVKVSPGVQAAIVLIMLKLKDVTSGESTAWGGGAIMNKEGNGVFTYTLTAESFTHYREFHAAWGQYQFVALDASRHRLGASNEYLNNLTVAPCP